CFDTVSVCLSKGLGAPVGSVLVGSEALIQQARRERKALGGGMRQAGLVAAAALHALENHRDDLQRDHDRARELAEGLSTFKAVQLDPSRVETNIIMFDITDGRSAADVLAALEAVGVRMVPFGPTRIRATTHRDIGDTDIGAALERGAPILDPS
ncbi:MAG: beta-eliminating lyase-related protein, partial [Rhodothermales bacterium]